MILDEKFHNILMQMICLDKTAIRVLLAPGGTLREQKIEIQEIKKSKQEIQDAINKIRTEERQMAPEEVRVLQEALESCMTAFEIIDLFIEENTTGQPLVAKKYTENIIFTLKDVAIKVSEAISKAPLYSDIPIHQLTANYINEIFEDGSKVTIDVLKASSLEECTKLIKAYEEKRVEKMYTPFLSIINPAEYRVYITPQLTRANPNLTPQELESLIESTQEKTTREMQVINQTLGEHAQQFSKKETSAEKLGHGVLGDIRVIETMQTRGVADGIWNILRTQAQQQSSKTKQKESTKSALSKFFHIEKGKNAEKKGFRKQAPLEISSPIPLAEVASPGQAANVSSLMALSSPSQAGKVPSPTPLGKPLKKEKAPSKERKNPLSKPESKLRDFTTEVVTKPSGLKTRL